MSALAKNVCLQCGETREALVSVIRAALLSDDFVIVDGSGTYLDDMEADQATELVLDAILAAGFHRTSAPAGLVAELRGSLENLRDRPDVTSAYDTMVHCLAILDRYETKEEA